MNNEIQSLEFEGNKVRTAQDENGNPLFCGTDVGSGCVMVLQNELKDASRIPLKDRLAWTIPQAASLYGIDYDGLRQAVNQGDIDTFRPPSKRGTPSRRHIRREEMDRYVKSLEE